VKRHENHPTRRSILYDARKAEHHENRWLGVIVDVATCVAIALASIVVALHIAQRLGLNTVALVVIGLGLAVASSVVVAHQ